MGVQFRVIWSQRARNQLKKLGPETERRIVKKVRSILGDPFRHIKRLRGSEFYSLRVGKHRAIMSVKANKLIIFVVRVGHRKKVYRSLD